MCVKKRVETFALTEELVVLCSSYLLLCNMWLLVQQRKMHLLF